jgi:hypothetical protein
VRPRGLRPYSCMHYHAPPPPCGKACRRFLRAMGVDAEMTPAIPAPDVTKVAIVSCSPLTRGGPQLRCSETARVLTAHGLPTKCFGPVTAIGIGRNGCQSRDFDSLLDPVLALGGGSVIAVIFLRMLPHAAQLQRIHCTLGAPVLLDTMDAGFTTTCTKSAALLSALVADNEISLTTRVMPDKCSTLRPVPAFNIEHFHSVTRRVNWGGGGLGRALLLQEHRIRGPLCGDIRTALARGGVDHFDCSALWGTVTIDASMHA